MSAPRLTLGSDGLTVRYGAVTALHDVTVRVHGGRLTGLVGPNGSGKSSWIAAVTGLVAPAAGTTWLERVDARGDATRTDGRGALAWVPQRNHVDRDFPVTVADVVRHGRWARLRWWQRERDTDREAVERALEATGLVDLRRRALDELSGGQLQRVFVARALAQEGDVYLFDEPFAGVDRASEQRIVEVMHGLRDAGRVVVVVHHDLSQVPSLFDDVVILAGRCVAAGPVGEVFTEANLDAAWSGTLGPLARRWTGEGA